MITSSNALIYALAYLKTQPLPDIASIEALAQQIEDELKPFLP